MRRCHLHLRSRPQRFCGRIQRGQVWTNASLAPGANNPSRPRGKRSGERARPTEPPHLGSFQQLDDLGLHLVCLVLFRLLRRRCGPREPGERCEKRLRGHRDRPAPRRPRPPARPRPGTRRSPANSGSSPCPRAGVPRLGRPSAPGPVSPARSGSRRAAHPPHRRPAARSSVRPRRQRSSRNMPPARPQRTTSSDWRGTPRLAACAMTSADVTPPRPASRPGAREEFAASRRRTRVACHGGHAAGGRGGAPERDGCRCAGRREKYGPRAFYSYPAWFCL